MKARDVIISGGEAWEIIKETDGGRQIQVRLIAGEGTEARNNDIPTAMLVRKPLYRRVADLADVDVHRAAVEVARYSVDLKRVAYFPRLWVEEFLKRYPTGSAVPDATIMLGWFANLINAGEEKVIAVKKERVIIAKKAKRPKQPIKKVARRRVKK